VAEYVQLPTVKAPSVAISALISSSVMSFSRIETCFVAAAALADAAADSAALGLAATEAGACVAPVEAQAETINAAMATSARGTRGLVWLLMSTGVTLLLVVADVGVAGTSGR
jgi:hypothetical protein